MSGGLIDIKECIRLEKCRPDRREPGLTIFNIRPGGSVEQTTQMGWIIGINQQGEVALKLPFDTQTQDVRSLPNGNLVFSRTGDGLITEMTRTGEVIRHWHAAGRWRGKTLPEGSTELDIPFFHHTFNLTPDGNFILLGAEQRIFDDWPSSDSEPNPPLESAKVIGDIIYEISSDGTLLNQWHMLDILDPYRMCYGSRSKYWCGRGFPDSNDWGHANSVSHDPADNSFIVSLRTQDCIVKIDRSSGDLKWILGDPGNWRAPWSDKLLKAEGDVDWSYHQHDATATPESGILCFDNGNYRATPFDEKMPEAESYSRAAEYAIDEKTGTVSQRWSYGEGDGEKLFACYQGGAFRLPETGNTLITYGGTVTMNGAPSGDVENGFCQARLVEVSPDKEILFDLWIDASQLNEPIPLSVFRAEHAPES